MRPKNIQPYTRVVLNLIAPISQFLPQGLSSDNLVPGNGSPPFFCATWFEWLREKLACYKSWHGHCRALTCSLSQSGQNTCRMRSQQCTHTRACKSILATITLHAVQQKQAGPTCKSTRTVRSIRQRALRLERQRLRLCCFATRKRTWNVNVDAPCAAIRRGTPCA